MTLFSSNICGACFRDGWSSSTPDLLNEQTFGRAAAYWPTTNVGNLGNRPSDARDESRLDDRNTTETVHLGCSGHRRQPLHSCP